jgi:hypothetical protein
MKEIALVTLITEGDEMVIDAYTDFDKANEVVVDLIFKTGNPNYYVQYVELH